MKTFLGVLTISLTATTVLLAANEALTIDGNLEDAFWKGVAPQRLVPSQDGVTPATGGELRIAVRGRYLCVGARLPEPGGRITARLAGINPSWEDEDLLRIVAGGDIGYTDRLLEINPLGAYSVEKALHNTITSLPVYPYSTERKAQTVYTGVRKFLVATSVGDNGWTVEAAIPLSELSASGPQRIYATVERVRAARPGRPQERWRWPANGVAAHSPFSASVSWDAPAPVYRPAPLGNREPPLQAGHIRQLPQQTVGWDEEPWRDAPVWRLVRDEPVRIEPRFPTEVKALHDGRMLAVLARCIEPGPVVARVQENDGPVGSDDSFHVYLATSGSMFAQFTVNPLGFLLDTISFTGGERLSRAREWSSGARVTAQRQSAAWTARIDIPLGPVAAALGETSIPSGWRVLFLRSRPGRDGEPPEKTVLPIIQTDTVVCPFRYRRLELSDAEPARLARSGAPAPPAGLAAFDARVFSAEERKQLRLGSMISDRLHERVRQSLQAEQRDWEQVKTLADWERFRDPRVKALAASFGAFPARTPLNIQITTEYAGQDYRRQNLVYESRPGLWVTANLYLPAKPTGSMPGILVVHSHHRPRTQAELQDMGILWARLGCAVLIMDQIGHGERIQNYPWNREPYHSRYIMGMQMYLAGESLLKWMVWDLMRGIDLLVARLDVDPRKIIMLGAVAAGGEPAVVTAALDKRVAAVAPFNFGDINPGMGEWESTRGLRRSTIDQFFPWLIGAAAAPRRYIYSKEVGWDSYRTHPGWERLQKVFALYGLSDNLDRAYGFGVFPGPGECANIGPSQRSKLYPPLNRWFGISVPAAEPDDRRPEEELAALTPAIASKLHMRPLHELAREVAAAKLETARARRQGLATEERRKRLRADLAARLGDIEPNSAASATVRWRKTYGGAEIEGITIESERGIIVPMKLFRPANAARKRLPVVVLVAESGAGLFFSQRSTEIEALLKGGVAVCLVDARGTGETAFEPRRGLRSEGESAATTHFMLGDTMLGARLKDLRTAIAYLAARTDVEVETMAVWGDSFSPPNPPYLLVDEIIGWQMGPELQQQAEPLGGLLALLAALYEDRIRVVAARRSLASYLSILDDQFAYVPNDIIVPSILEVGDVNDIAATLAPRALLLESLVDGRNRIVSSAALKQQMAPVADAYRGAPERFVLTDAGATNLPQWMLLRLREDVKTRNVASNRSHGRTARLAAR